MSVIKEKLKKMSKLIFWATFITTLMYYPLDYKRAISIVKEYPTSGHRPILVLTEDYKEYIVKTINNKFDNSSIINEFLCLILK